MRWIEPDPGLAVPPALHLSLLQGAMARAPDNAALRARLGEALLKTGDFAGALAAYARAATADAENFRDWAALAKCHLRLGDAEAALAVCDRAAAQGRGADILYQRGCALSRLDRDGEARDALLLCVAQGREPLAALRELLRPLAKDPDGGRLLAFCDGLPPAWRDSALVLAHRAIALSRLGRTDDACALVDLERHVARVPFAPPAEFGGLENFNRILADDILADPSPRSPARDGVDIDYYPQFRASPAFDALRVFLRAEIERHLSQLAAMGLDSVLPAPPLAGTLEGAGVVLRGEGRNGEHVHGGGYVSAVYHASVPDSIVRANGPRGALALGACEAYTAGHTPCWGTRFIKPVAGWLVLFPSHVFHDTVPSHSAEARISVAADLKPVRLEKQTIDP